jgi:hypothetical protein
MVYNEGFEINFNKTESYFVFLKYGENKEHKFDSHWVSYCHETLVGWFHTSEGWGCFHGIKDGTTPGVPTNGEAREKQIVTENSIVQQESYRFLGTESMLQLNAEFKDHARFVEKINDMGLSWKAANYEQFQGKTLKELNNMYRKAHTVEGKTNVANVSPNRSFINTSLRPKVVYNCEELPKVFNYTEYMGPARSQVI